MQETVDSHSLFGTSLHWQVPILAASDHQDLVPEIDPNYCFDDDTTLAILAGFVHQQRVLIQGFHGTGKSTHIEQIAARLNWPVMRINLDGHISRLDLVGKDIITIKEGKQVTDFAQGLVPWSLQRPIALVFDELDAARPDVLFVLQRLLERNGKFTLLDQNQVLKPHDQFRLFATSNTVGLGNTSGLYHGTQLLNQAMLDRFSIVATLNYLALESEVAVVLAATKSSGIEATSGRQIDPLVVPAMVELATLTRVGFQAGDVSTLMSPRTVMSWLSNSLIFNDIARGFRLAYLNRCDEMERQIIAEYYQRCMGRELAESYVLN